jgi:hypothetical protein
VVSGRAVAGLPDCGPGTLRLVERSRLSCRFIKVRNVVRTRIFISSVKGGLITATWDSFSAVPTPLLTTLLHTIRRPDGCIRIPVLLSLGLLGKLERRLQDNVAPRAKVIGRDVYRDIRNDADAFEL